MNENIKPKRLGFYKYPNSDKAHQSNTFYDPTAISPTLDTCTGGNRQVKIMEEKMEKIKIRKLTPSECYKLMGFTAEDCQKASDGGVKKTNLYKTAGNSIVVNVLEAIYLKLGERYEEFKPCERTSTTSKSSLTIG